MVDIYNSENTHESSVSKLETQLDLVRDEDGKTYAVYSLNEVQRVQKVLFDALPTHHRHELSKWLTVLHPEAINGKATSADYIMLPIFDGPKYTQLTQEFPIETQHLYVRFAKRHNERLNNEAFYQNLRPIKIGNGGDEKTTMFEIGLTNPLEVTAYALDAEIDFLEELIDPKNEKVLSLLQELGVPAPYVCVGVTNGGVSFKYCDLFPDPETGAVETRLIMFGKKMKDSNETTLAAQDMAKEEFVRSSKSVTDTKEHWIAKHRHQDMPDMIFPNIEGQSARYFETMRAAGLTIEEPTDESPFYTIDFPHGHIPSEILAKLKQASAKIKEENKKLKGDLSFEDRMQLQIKETMETSGIKRLDLERFFQVAKQTTWQCWAEGETFPYLSHAKKDKLNTSGEAAFYHIKGYRELREALERAQIDEDRITEMLVEAAHHTLYEISRITGQARWKVENQQADKLDNFNVILNHNIITPDPKRQSGIIEHPEIFDVIEQGALYLISETFKQDLAKKLTEKFYSGSGMSEKKFRDLIKEAVETVHFIPTVAFTTCDLKIPSTGWYIYVDPSQMEHEWGSIVGGPHSSVDARLAGNVANLSIEKNMRDLLAKKEKNPDVWTKDDEDSLESYRSTIAKLRRINQNKIPSISMPDEVRERLGIPEDHPNLIIIKHTKLKGLPTFDSAVRTLLREEFKTT